MFSTQPNEHLDYILNYLPIKDLPTIKGISKRFDIRIDSNRKVLQLQKLEWGDIIEGLGPNVTKNERIINQLGLTTIELSDEEKEVMITARESLLNPPKASKEKTNQLMEKYFPDYAQALKIGYAREEDIDEDSVEFKTNDLLNSCGDRNAIVDANWDDYIHFHPLHSTQLSILKSTGLDRLRIFTQDPDRFSVQMSVGEVHDSFGREGILPVYRSILETAIDHLANQIRDKSSAKEIFLTFYFCILVATNSEIKYTNLLRRSKRFNILSEYYQFMIQFWKQQLIISRLKQVAIDLRKRS